MSPHLRLPRPQPHRPSGVTHTSLSQIIVPSFLMQLTAAVGIGVFDLGNAVVGCVYGGGGGIRRMRRGNT